MKKIIIPILLIVLTSILLVSCGNKDEVADEIVRYYNEEWIPINDMKEKGMRDIPLEVTKLEDEGKKNEAVTLVKDEVLPLVDRVLERLKSVDSKNGKVKEMTDLQIEAEEFSKDMSKDIIVYYEGGDVSELDIKEYDEELQEKYQDVLDYRDKLMDKYNLEQTENEDEDSKFYKLKRAED